jgi:hypothetical protein
MTFLESEHAVQSFAGISLISIDALAKISTLPPGWLQTWPPFSQIQPISARNKN